jgi:hypothetical protein
MRTTGRLCICVHVADPMNTTDMTAPCFSPNIVLLARPDTRTAGSQTFSFFFPPRQCLAHHATKQKLEWHSIPRIDRPAQSAAARPFPGSLRPFADLRLPCLPWKLSRRTMAAASRALIVASKGAERGCIEINSVKTCASKAQAHPGNKDNQVGSQRRVAAEVQREEGSRTCRRPGRHYPGAARRSHRLLDYLLSVPGMCGLSSAASAQGLLGRYQARQTCFLGVHHLRIESL